MGEIVNCKDVCALFDEGKKRYHVVGTEEAGVIAGLDLEGRFYAVLHGEVLNRVNPKAILETSTRDGYLNPGGDGLWPAPEGSCLGYEYSTGRWRVPPGLTGARYWLKESTRSTAVIRAEIDLINASGLGVPAAFERRVSVSCEKGALVMTVVEAIEYLGDRSLSPSQCLLVPWTLAQFDCGPGCEVVFPSVGAGEVWDLYDPSDDQRRVEGGLWRTRTDGGKRYQIGIGTEVDWIEYRDPRRKLVARRSTELLPSSLSHIDIADRPPCEKPSAKNTRFSVYSDVSGFMEIEAAGGVPTELKPGAVMAVTVRTEYAVGG